MGKRSQRPKVVQYREEKKKRKEQRRALTQAYVAQDPSGRSTQTVDSSTLPCPYAKAGIEVTLASTKDRAIKAAKVTFSDGTSTLERPAKDLKAFLPLKKPCEISYTGTITEEATGFEKAELSGKKNAPENELATAKLDFKPKPSKLTVKVFLKGTEDLVPGAKVSVDDEAKAADKKEGTVYDELYDVKYLIEVTVDEEEYLEPDGVEKEIPLGGTEAATVYVSKRPRVKFKVHDTTDKKDVDGATVKVTLPDTTEVEKETASGVAEFKLDDEAAEDAKCSVREVVLKDDGPFEFVSVEAS